MNLIICWKLFCGKKKINKKKIKKNKKIGLIPIMKKLEELILDGGENWKGRLNGK